LIGAGVGVVGIIVFGILEVKTEGDYNKATSQTQKDSLNTTGVRYALLTNVGIALAAVGGIGAAIAGYPLVFGSSEKKTALVLTPAIGPGLTGGVATLRF
jgi:hypothetical protein